ncbi:DUF4270 family protein [Pseudozobellia thermophila]|uniref:DUF4270 domain-containing protein n=1 Tax=Pseudozobellia thermophila TaxID=192903 RepID=A0A1M6AR22_9FLAO|nr:DUF4270 family protein [Pseudozobellia thermophila]SHI38916.1 protein of unknown function [Pseudozobellia thermophila]
MTFLKRFNFSALAVIFVMAAIVACEQDPTTIGSGVIGSSPLNTDIAVFDVFAKNRKIGAVSTNKLPVYQLGSFTHPVYGKTEASITSQLQLSSIAPTFGIYSQSTEDNPSSDSQIPENEKIDSVYLYIPFLTNPSGDSDGDGLADEFDGNPDDAGSDTDGDGLTDAQEISRGTDPLNSDTDGDGVDDAEDDEFIANQYRKTFDLDSIYVNGKPYDKNTGEVSFNLKVQRSNYYLRDLDPNSNFLEAQEYFSDQGFDPTFVDSLLFDGPVVISPDQIPLKNRDLASTEDVDESEELSYLDPGIRVALDKDFFQHNILDMEGSTELANQENFKNYLRGLHLSLSSLSDEVMLLLDMRRANITLSYSYDTADTDGEVSEGAGKKEFVLNFITSVLSQGQDTGLVTGNAVNTLVNDPYPGEVSGAMDTDANAEKIYLKGGAGAFAEINLFDQGNGKEAIKQIRQNNWVVNEANLVFYVAEDTDVEQPPSLYLYNTETGLPVYGAPLSQNDQLVKVYDYDGQLEKSSDGKALKYTVKITEHINDLIIRDVENATLGLFVTSSLYRTDLGSAVLDGNTEGEVPVASILSPLGTILYGSNVDDADADKKLRLEIFYTEID